MDDSDTSPNCDMANIKMKMMERSQLSPLASKLIDRIEVDFRKYGAIPTVNQLIAMLVNPLSCDIGFNEIQMTANRVAMWSQ